MRLFYRKKMLENRHFLIGIFQHFTTVADIRLNFTIYYDTKYNNIDAKYQYRSIFIYLHKLFYTLLITFTISNIITLILLSMDI